MRTGSAAGQAIRDDSRPVVVEPIRLTMARSNGSRNSRGVGLPGCGCPVTVPISTDPNPNAARASIPWAFLSNPAASPSGLATRRPNTSNARLGSG